MVQELVDLIQANGGEDKVDIARSCLLARIWQSNIEW